MKFCAWFVLAIGCATGLGGCVINVRGVAEKKPQKPVEHAIFVLGVPVYWSSDTTHSECCGEHVGCPAHGMKGMPPMPPPSGFHHRPGAWGRPGHWEKPGEAKKDCCDKKESEKPMECCEKKGEEKMECCKEKSESGAAHDHSAHEAPKGK